MKKFLKIVIFVLAIVTYLLSVDLVFESILLSDLTIQSIAGAFVTVVSIFVILFVALGSLFVNKSEYKEEILNQSLYSGA